MRDRLSHPAEGLCNMQICLFIPCLPEPQHYFSWELSMWPVSRWKPDPRTCCWPVFVVVPPDKRMSQDAAWHTQREGGAAKTMCLHQSPNPWFIHKLQQCPRQGEGRTEWVQIQRIFWGLIFLPFSPEKNRMHLPLTVFLTWHTDSRRFWGSCLFSWIL